MTESLVWLVAGGLGGWAAFQMAEWARRSPRTTGKQPPDKLAELERAVQSYRAEVTDLADLVERRYRRDVVRDKREKSTEISTAFPQGELDTKAAMRQAWLLSRRRR